MRPAKPKPKSTRCEQCRKKAYPTQAYAIHAALGNSILFGTPLRAYKCPHGQGWHLTKQRLA